MRNFLKSLDCIKNKTLALDLPSNFTDTLLRCQPFVIGSKPEDNEVTKRHHATIEEEACDLRTKALEASEVCDAPFPVFSIELELEKHCFYQDGFYRDGVWVDCYVDCIFIVEKSPKVFSTYFFMTTDIEGSVSPSTGIYSEASMVGLSFLNQTMKENIRSLIKINVSAFLTRLTNGVVGHASTSERFKYRASDGSKKTHTFSQIIYVGSKSDKQDSDRLVCGRFIDWTYRFSVRGHWRLHEGRLGKNREGVYNVEGFTWVSDYVKGPEDAPIVKKQRVLTT